MAATATRRTVKSSVKPAAKPAKRASVKPAVKKSTPKPAVKATPKVKPAAAPKVTREQDSVTGTFALAKLPKGGGGVRFEDTQDRGFSPVYVQQSDWTAIGQPKSIRVTIKAL